MQAGQTLKPLIFMGATSQNAGINELKLLLAHSENFAETVIGLHANGVQKRKGLQTVGL